MAAELDKYVAVFSSNMSLLALFIGPFYNSKMLSSCNLSVCVDNNDKFIGCHHIGFCIQATAIIHKNKFSHHRTS